MPFLVYRLIYYSALSADKYPAIIILQLFFAYPRIIIDSQFSENNLVNANVFFREATDSGEHIVNTLHYI